MLVVTDVLVSPFSAVAEMCEGVSSDSDGESVEPQYCSCGESRRHELRMDASRSTTDIQEEDVSAHATGELVLVNRAYAVAN